MGHLAEHGLDQRTLATAIRPDQRMNAARPNLEVDVIENRRAAQSQADVGELHAGAVAGNSDFFQEGHAPAS